MDAVFDFFSFRTEMSSARLKHIIYILNRKWIFPTYIRFHFKIYNLSLRKWEWKTFLFNFLKSFQNNLFLNFESKSVSAYFELTELFSLKQNICTTAALIFQQYKSYALSETFVSLYHYKDSRSQDTNSGWKQNQNSDTVFPSASLLICYLFILPYSP